jgi:hypothetical protein
LILEVVSVEHDQRGSRFRSPAIDTSVASDGDDEYVGQGIGDRQSCQFSRLASVTSATAAEPSGVPAHRESWWPRSAASVPCTRTAWFAPVRIVEHGLKRAVDHIKMPSA